MGAIYTFMASATRTLDMTMYELADRHAEQILESDAAHGVDVRVLLDRAYHGGSVNQSAHAALSAHGVHVAWANQATIFHQKTITVDGVESVVMTGNLTAEHHSTDRNFAVFDTAPADVHTIVDAFDGDESGSNPGPASTGSPRHGSPRSPTTST